MITVTTAEAVVVELKLDDIIRIVIYERPEHLPSIMYTNENGNIATVTVLHDELSRILKDLKSRQRLYPSEGLDIKYGMFKGY